MIKKALFIQKDGTIGGAVINIDSCSNNKKNINIYTYNDNGTLTGRTTINQIHNDEYYIFDIYCYATFRGNGIGSSMLKIVESLVEPNVVIRGTFLPYQDKGDKIKGHITDYEKIFSNARDFYISNGYEFTKSNDFTKVAKKVIFNEYNFASVDDILYDTKLCDYNINPSDQLIKKLSLR